MGSHVPSAGPKSQLDTYQHATDHALDQYKQGKIDVTKAHQAHDEAVALLVQALYSAYLVRLRNLQAFRVPAGEIFVERVER